MKKKNLFLEEDILRAIKYFSFFQYYPNLIIIYSFLRKKTSKKAFKEAILNLERQKKIKKINNQYAIFNQFSKNTPPQYSIDELKNRVVDQKKRRKISQQKLKNWRFRLYCWFLSLLPQIKLVGLSGTLSMMNANEEDDIDLFIITAKNRLFTARFIAIVLAEFLGLRRRRDTLYSNSKFHVPNFKDKVCLNLFFDEGDLVVPDFKKNEYVAHEVLQMKPIVNKNYTYEKFLSANRWILSFFPNAAEISNFKFLISNQFQISKFKNYKLNKNLKLKIENLSDWLENQLKKFQLKLIRKHQTTELIIDTQLWFHPDDFEKKLYD